ncbi:MAG: ArsR/SmtB family transcription factor [Chloroflexota bacterium]
MCVDNGHAGWVVNESIALELDHALAVVGGGYALGALAAEDAALLDSVAADWRAQWSHFLGEPRSSVSLLELAASVGDVLAEDSYDRATLALRTMTVEVALAGLVEQTRALGLSPDLALPPPERLADLAVRAVTTTYRSIGLEPTPDSTAESQLVDDAARLPAILMGGNLHAHFWHWLDRFYYEFYRPWRSSRSEVMRQLKRRAVLALGAAEKTGVSPDTAWLDPHNPVLRYPELRTAVQSGKLRVLFWVEPFGLADSWTLLPGLVAVSFAEPGARFEHFQEVATDLARRASALSDPTRLIVLRLIRNFGMTNTDIADYLGLARPTVSVHAKVLRDAGLIRSHQEGRLVRHEIVPSEVRRLFRELERFLDLPSTRCTARTRTGPRA